MSGNRIPRVPKLCVRKDGRLYATDPLLKKPVYFKDARAYEDWRQTFIDRAEVLSSSIEPREVLPGQRVSVSRLCEAYLLHANRYYRKDGQPTSEVNVIAMMVRRLVAVVGDRPANSLRVRDIEDVQARMVADGLSRKTCNHLLRKLRTLFRWGVRQEVVTGETLGRILSVEVLKRGRTAARERPKVGPVDPAIVEKTLPHMRPAVAAMVTVQLCAGMRPGEVVRLKPSEIDRSREPWEYAPARWKTEHRMADQDGDERRRLILFGPRARAALLPFLDASPDPESPLFRTRTGKPFDSATYRSVVYHCCRKAGVPRWHPNQLRHSAATAVRRQFDAEHARAYLGHDHLKTTEVYAELDRDKARRVAEEMG